MKERTHGQISNYLREKDRELQTLETLRDPSWGRSQAAYPVYLKDQKDLWKKGRLRPSKKP